MPGKKSAANARRDKLSQEYWPGEDLWTGEQEKGWFPALRTLPLILALMASKAISQQKNPSSVYLELMSRHITSGLIEMDHEADHAFAAGYEGPRAVRTWEERMKILEDHGFIHTRAVGNQRYKYVAIVHPTTAIQRLHEQGKISAAWWSAYVDRKLKTSEATFEQRQALIKPT